MFAGKLVLEWWEREHEDIDTEELQDPLTLNSLRRCGLLKFFHTMNICTQLRLLESLVWLWDPNQGLTFNLQGETLNITA